MTYRWAKYVQGIPHPQGARWASAVPCQSAPLHGGCLPSTPATFVPTTPGCSARTLVPGRQRHCCQDGTNVVGDAGGGDASEPRSCFTLGPCFATELCDTQHL